MPHPAHPAAALLPWRSVQRAAHTPSSNSVATLDLPPLWYLQLSNVKEHVVAAAIWSDEPLPFQNSIVP